MAGRPRDEHTAERFLVDVDEEKLRAQALLALVDAAPGAIDELGPDKGLTLICARLLRAMDCTTAVLSLVDFGRDTLESVVGYDVSGVRTAVRGSRALAVDAVAARVIGNREPLFAAPDPDPTQPLGPAAPFEGGWLALPLVLRGECVGMIELLAGHRERRTRPPSSCWLRACAPSSLKPWPTRRPSPNTCRPRDRRATVAAAVARAAAPAPTPRSARWSTSPAAWPRASR